MVMTALETTVLAAMVQNALDAAGGDFGFMDEIDYKALGLTAQQFGGVVTSLQTKGLVNVDQPYKVNGEYWVTQFTVTVHGWASSGRADDSPY